MGRKPVAYAPVCACFAAKRCSGDKCLQWSRGQRPTGGYFNKHPMANHKGIGGSYLLHLLAHVFLHTQVKDYCPVTRCITPVDGFAGVQ